MAMSKAGLDLGRAAYDDHRWGEAFGHFGDAHREGGLPAADLERFATVAVLTGHPRVGTEALTRAYEEYLLIGDVPGAVRCAAWLSVHLLNSGEAAACSGWLARGTRLLAEIDEPGAAEGLLLIPAAVAKLYGGEAAEAAALFGKAYGIGTAYRDRDVTSLAQLGQGQAQVMLGNPAAGLELFDEVMVAATAGEVSAIPCGIIYCVTIGTCQSVFDLPRALEWTAALDRWCRNQPDLVLFSGQCHAHRAELYALRGQWDDAMAAAAMAQERCSRGDPQARFGAFYYQGEVQRLRGLFEASVASYRAAADSGFDPQPGMALLHLARGEVQLARRQINDAVAAADPTWRSRLLPGLVEIELAAGDLAAARSAADDLGRFAAGYPAPMPRALAAQADGAVLVEEGEPAAALKPLRTAWTLWRTLENPYEAARCRVLVAKARRRLGDEETARMDFEAAREELEELGAGPAFAMVDALIGAVQAAEPGASGGVPDGVVNGPLTGREVEVLRLVAAGKSNRAVAVELFLSEKTVARHLSNIFLKLEVTSRVAASRYAYEHGLMA
ncbi:helix-turn-helix transcriptional regulator [Arthrobacter celericrescens]|uniref:helix-turn-helix transcriptional regulator n=1 Tax=Arthrobacter celericrescens TaxID=2320851 RepID=UPI000EA1FF22|nr:helix-turn-helix transcriptional regulator [Arthrobacter celericrescens]